MDKTAKGAPRRGSPHRRSDDWPDNYWPFGNEECGSRFQGGKAKRGRKISPRGRSPKGCGTGRGKGKFSMGSGRGSAKGGVGRLPICVLNWTYFAAAFSAWEAAFLILRPMTLPGGKLNVFFKPFDYFILVDKRYRDASDYYTFGIGLFTGGIAILNALTILSHNENCRHTVPLAFSASVADFWLTLFYLYSYTEFGGGKQYRIGNPPGTEFCFFWVPTTFWLVMLALVMKKLYPQFSGEKCSINKCSTKNAFYQSCGDSNQIKPKLLLERVYEKDYEEESE